MNINNCKNIFIIIECTISKAEISWLLLILPADTEMLVRQFITNWLWNYGQFRTYTIKSTLNKGHTSCKQYIFQQIKESILLKFRH